MFLTANPICGPSCSQLQALHILVISVSLLRCDSTFGNNMRLYICVCLLEGAPAGSADPNLVVGWMLCCWLHALGIA